MDFSTSGTELGDVVAQAVDEYFASLKRGESPALDEFVERYPEIGHVLKTLIPALNVTQDCNDSVNGSFVHGRSKQIGDFRILRQIGRGGMGIVYEAEQISMNRRVALKVLPLTGLVDEVRIRRFQNEVRAVAALNHPHIVPVYTINEERGVHYYAMQLIAGRSLAEVIDSLRHDFHQGKELDGSSLSQITRTGRVADRATLEAAARVVESDVPAAAELAALSQPSENSSSGDEHPNLVERKAQADSSTIPHSSRREYFRSVASLGIQAATALQHAHDEGVIHRDIKPANLLLDCSTKLYVTDFGLARIESAAGVTMTGDLVGTLRYMAPEQALGNQAGVDCRADVYSLGVTLYELLALRPAYPTEDRQQLLKQIAAEEPTRLRRIAPEIPAELETIVHKAMSKEAAERYPSAQELANDLQLYLDNRPIKAKPPTISEIVGKWTRRNPALTWSAIITLTLVTMTLVASLFVIAGQRRIAQEAERDARKTAETRRQELYAAQISLAYQAWLDGNLQRAQELLAALRPEQNQTDLRGFEWRYLWKLCQDQCRETLLTRAGRGFGELPLSLSKDGKRLAIIDGKMVRIWDFTSGREIHSDVVHATNLRALAISPTNADLLATAADDETIWLWDLTTNAAPKILAKGTLVRSLAFSPGGEKLASGNRRDGSVELWDIQTRVREWKTTTGHRDRERPEPALCVAFSPVGNLIASGGGDTHVRLWNAKTGEQIGAPLEQHTAWVVSLDFSPDGRLLVSGGLDGRVVLWDVATHEVVAELLGHQGWVASVVFSPDGEAVVSGGGDGTIRRWEVATTKQMSILRGHFKPMELAVLPSGQSLVSCSPNTVKLWDMPTERSEQHSFDHDGWVSAVALSPDGSILASSDYHAHLVRLWNVHSGHSMGSLPVDTGDHQFLAISPDGKSLASAGGKVVRLWDLNTRREKVLSRGLPFNCVAFSSDSKTLAAAGETERAATGLKFWNVTSGREIEMIRGDTDSIHRVEFSPRGRWLLTTATDGKGSLWDTNTGSEVPLYRAEVYINCVAFSGDGQLVAFGKDDGSIALVDINQPEDVRRLQGHVGSVASVAFDPDGKTLASTGRDGTTRFWNIASGQTALTVRHLGPVADVTFSSDGSLMATCGADGTARLWPAASLSEADAGLIGGDERDHE